MASNVISVAITSQTGGLRKGLKSAQGSLGAFDKSTKRSVLGLGTLAKGFVGFAAVSKAGQFLKGSINEARDLSETLNKSKVIFGAQASAMDKWSDKSAKAFGLSKSAALAAATSYGDMFTQLGFTGKEAANTSQSVVKMAADLGSFSNLDTGDVLDRISGAFRGEYDSLQKVIPNINAARVEKEALALSGKKLTKELTAQDKAQAVLAIIQKDGAKAQGDFARTSDGLANRQKILAARTKDLQAKLGKLLLPAVNLLTLAGIKLVDGLSNIGPAVSAIKGFFDKYGTAIKVTGGVITAIFLPAMIQATAAFVAQLARTVALNAAWLVYGITVKGIAIATKAYTAAQWLLNAALSANPIGLVIIGLVALGAGFVLLWKKSETFRNIVTGAFNKVKSAASTAFNWVKKNWPLLLAILTGPIGLAVLAIVKKRDAIISAFKAVPGKIKSALGNAGTMLKDAGRAIIEGLIKGITGKLGDLYGKVSGIGSKIKSLKGPLSYDKVMLKPEGAAIIAGLIGGIESEESRLYGTVGRISRTLAGTSMTVGSGGIGPSQPGISASRGGGVTNVIHVTVNAPVGSDSASIGRELEKHMNEWLRVSGRAS